MNIIKLNLNLGSVYFDSTPIEVDEHGILIASIAKLCSPPIKINQVQTRYRLLQKTSVCGQSADCVIEVSDGRILSVTFLFDLIIFFESSILESKIIKAFEKSFNLKFKSSHPSTAALESCKWGSAIFSYDAKQGDLSLEIRFEGMLNKISSAP